jgi:fused signal recognition particle receptor
MGLFDKLFKRNKEQEVAKETLDKGLEKTKQSFLAKYPRPLPESRLLTQKFWMNWKRP